MKKRIGYRIFLVVGDEVSPLTKTAFDEFYFRRQAVLQSWAGKTIDIATVVCRIENTKLREIVRIYCQRFKVKGDGSIDEDVSPRAPATLSRAVEPARRDSKQRDAIGSTEGDFQGRRLVHTLTMISSAAQRKILEVLRR